MQLTSQNGSATISIDTSLGNNKVFSYLTYDVAFSAPSELGSFAFCRNQASGKLRIAFRYNPGVDPSKKGIKIMRLNY